MRTFILAPGVLAVSVSLGAAAVAHRAASQDPLGPTEGSGLVIVAVAADMSRGPQDVRGYLVREGDSARPFEGVESNGVIAFSGLPPGAYRLDAIKARAMSGDTARPISVQLPRKVPGLSVAVKAGTPVYLGKVTIIDRARVFRVGRPEPLGATFDANRALAGQAWNRFLATHGKTAWAARVRQHLGGGAVAAGAGVTAGAPVTTGAPVTAAPAATPKAASPAPPPLETIEAQVKHANEAAADDAVREFRDKRRAELGAAESRLAAHLQANPDDTRAMLMAVRLGWLRESMPAPGADAGAPDAGFAALQAMVDGILAREPDNAEAHFWKARLLAVEVPAVKDGASVKVARNLPEAVTSARRAVELAPENVQYRQTLATLLVDDHKPSEALDVVRNLSDAAGAPSQIAAILSAWQMLPLPENAQEQRLLAKGFADTKVHEGTITNYPNMRVRMFTVPVRATDVEAFYKTYWNNFKLFKKESERKGSTQTTAFGQFMTWTKGRLEPATSERQADAAADYAAKADGLLLVVNEIVNLPPQDRSRFVGVTGDTFCQLTFLNIVSMHTR